MRMTNVAGLFNMTVKANNKITCPVFECYDKTCSNPNPYYDKKEEGEEKKRKV